MIEVFFKVTAIRFGKGYRISNSYCETIEEAMEHYNELKKYYGYKVVEVVKITEETEDDKIVDRKVETVKNS